MWAHTVARYTAIIPAVLALALGAVSQDARDVAIVAPDGSVEHGAKWALVIGINGYDEEEVGALKVAVADARRMHDCLVKQAGFSPDRVILFTDEGLQTAAGTRADKKPGYAELRGQLATFAGDHRDSDVLVVFFAGHGFYSEQTQKDYLAPLNVQRSDLEGTAIAVDHVLQLLRNSGARQAVLIVDACRNVVGRALPGQQDGVGECSLEAADSLGVWYLASCRRGQISREDTNLGGGVYTYYLTEGLGGVADGYGGGRRDGFVTVPEAQAYVEARVEAWSRGRGGTIQIPCRSEFDVSGGQLVLAVPGAYGGPAPATVETIATTAVLHVDGTPRGAEVYIDGHLKGTVPCDAMVQLDELQQRTVEVVVKSDGYATKAARVTVQRGGRAVWRVDLETVGPAPVTHPRPVPSGKPWERAGSRAGEEIVGPHGGVMLWVPGGSFMMGSEDGFGDEEPVHRVEVDGFWLGKTEVTVAEWRKVMGSVPGESNDQGDDHPVVEVSWDDAAEFCEKAGLELPTEAQWEYAARGPEGRAYPWGDAWERGKCCNRENRGPGGRTFPVGSFPAGASWCGVLDMAGNVWEWCSDRYGSDYYRLSPRQNPQNPGRPSSPVTRVVRGGAWGDSADLCRAANRLNDAPGGRSCDLGFRVSRSDL